MSRRSRRFLSLAYLLKDDTMSDIKHIIIHTDGSSKGNPGPGGYGAILEFRGQEKEISGGYRKTTNSRMELMAVIAALEALKQPCSVTIYSDSRYVVNSMTEGWARSWRKNGWVRNRGDRAENPDLWEAVLELCDRHDVEFRWVEAHSGDPKNERCDQLARAPAARPNLPTDEGYEVKGKVLREWWWVAPPDA